MEFRKAELHHVPQLLEMQEGYYRTERYPFTASVAERAFRQLITDSSIGALLILEQSGRVAAYLAVSFGFSLEFGGRDAFVDELYVNESARGQGIGKAALHAAEQFCRSAGIRALHLEVERTNQRAKGLYEQQGFREHSRHLMTKLLV